jgi:hypothetical protein
MNPLFPIWALGLGKVLGLLIVWIRGLCIREDKGPNGTENAVVSFYPREYILNLKG